MVKAKSKDLAILKHAQEPGSLGYHGLIAVLHVEGDLKKGKGFARELSAQE